VQANGEKVKKSKEIKVQKTGRHFERMVWKYRSPNLPVSGAVLRKKATYIVKRLHIDNFSASNGWIDHFKQRHNLV
jgi:hypothetical protein